MDSIEKHTSSMHGSYVSSPARQKALSEQKPPYHVFDHRRKRLLVYIVSLAGLFSPLSSNIYFPALGAIAKDFNTSYSLVTLSITVYMIVQGIAPSFWGPLSDKLGRRPIFIGTFTVYLIANVVLALSQDFQTLMVFRAIQAAGSASTISIGAGVIGDLTTSAERGGYMGIFGGIRMFGQSIGPVFGGILTQYLGFRSIFWALTILGGITLVFIVIFLPETQRPIAGDGTVRLYGVSKPLTYYVTGQPHVTQEPDPDRPKARISLKTVVSPLRFLFEKDVFITLFYGAIVYTIWSMVTSSTTSIFEQKYGLNSLYVGLAYLPNGFGCILGSYTTGLIMNYDYRRTEAEYWHAPAVAFTAKVDLKAEPDFPIERARQRNLWWIISAFVLTTGGYGFSLQMDIDLPLVLQFLIAYTATAVFSINSTLVVDLYPGASAGATATNNLVRCSLGAAGVAVVQPLLNALSPKWTFLMLAAIAAVFSPLLYVESKWGPRWRKERNARLAKKQEEEC
ncbi:MFS general substrate transporter [Saccharata proteae CBS 121410]|uniref:MFS general substrate transporter n=1 Tax=Saccharata proteae CBS 121410 TaxID=1314787 RepID=A0A9P4LTV4_9PEZI|nr:MFS general substrate transporter [Saccharata proteae CBS 121410]